jgi:hypothetical protein
MARVSVQPFVLGEQMAKRKKTQQQNSDAPGTNEVVTDEVAEDTTEVDETEDEVAEEIVNESETVAPVAQDEVPAVESDASPDVADAPPAVEVTEPEVEDSQIVAPVAHCFICTNKGCGVCVDGIAPHRFVI